MTVPNPFSFVLSAIIGLYARARAYAVLASPETQEAREAICEPCEFRDGEQCGVCGCFLAAKTALNTERCPKRKWCRVWEKTNTI